MRNKLIVLLFVFAAAGIVRADCGKGKVDAERTFEKLRVGVLVYGAGMMDGSEIQEVVIAMLALDSAKVNVVFFAPSDAQADVIDHNTYQTVTGETRNMLTESARITHGNVVPISKVSAADFDALILPGGLGFIKGVTTYARDGINFTINPDLQRILVDMHAAGKPIGFLCVTPIAAAKLFGKEKVTLTIGNNKDMIAQVEAMGARHVEAAASEIVVDKHARIVSSPAYMVGPDISTVASGIKKCVLQVLEMAPGTR
jgi:enhancing lycopene biosynthesis protein 2